MKMFFEDNQELIADILNEVFDYAEKNKDLFTIQDLWDFDLFFYNVERHAKGLKNEIRIIRRKNEKKLAKGK